MGSYLCTMDIWLLVKKLKDRRFRKKCHKNEQHELIFKIRICALHLRNT